MKKFALLKWEIKLYLAGWYFTLFEKTYKTGGCEFEIPFDKTTIRFRGQFPIDFYEKQERHHLKTYLPKGATVLELGGCLGIVSCLTNKILEHPEWHVVVEANPELIEILKRNRDRNGCRFQVENCMLSSRKENTFNLGDNILTSSARRVLQRTVTVPGKTLGDLENQYGLRFDALVMDIEGGELDFFRENRERIGQFDVIFMELHVHPTVLTREEGDEVEGILQNAHFEKVVEDSAGFQIWKRIEKQ